MAIDIKRTFYGWTDSQPIAMGKTVTIEGQALVSVLEDNVEKVKPATGVANEKVVGFARFRQLAFGVNAKVEDLVVPAEAPFTAELSKNNIVDYKFVGASVAPVLNTTTGVVTFDAADAGKIVTATYRWNMTVSEAKTTMYEAPVNHPDVNLMGMVGVGKGKGRIYTLHYDASKTYDGTTVLVVGADGIITVGGTGTAIPGGRVVQVPSTTDPYLGVEFLV